VSSETALWGRGLVPSAEWRPEAVRPLGVAVLGATGSVGRQTLDVVGRHPDRLRAVALSGHADGAALTALAAASGASVVGLASASPASPLGPGPWRAVVGADALEAVATAPAVDVVVAATPGLDALRAVLAALALGRRVALANKEILIAGGDLITRAVRAHGGLLLPLDSEHVAVHQLVRGERPEAVQRIILTASGGPFRRMPRQALADVDTQAALAHPTWRMGPMNTLNSATLMNKGFEVLEATRLFGLDPERVAVVVHPQSVVHSFVELVDSTVLAQLASADMRLPIQYALLYPDRAPSPAPRLDLWQTPALELEAVRDADFPSLSVAVAAGKIGGIAPAVLVAANEEAVAAFVAGRLAFPEIPEIVRAVLERTPAAAVGRVEDVETADAWARGQARMLVGANA
jgi:1-deoxy-D-xylulose-5-phosphate reductoisomerase